MQLQPPHQEHHEKLLHACRSPLIYKQAGGGAKQSFNVTRLKSGSGLVRNVELKRATDPLPRARSNTAARITSLQLFLFKGRVGKTRNHVSHVFKGMSVDEHHVVLHCSAHACPLITTGFLKYKCMFIYLFAG